MRFSKTAILLSAVVFALSASGCTGDNTQAAAAPVLTAVELSYPRTTDISKEMTYAGTVSAAESVNVVSRVTAKVTEVYFDVGDTVNAGDVLFKLDEKDVLDQLKQVTAQIAQAEAGIKQAENAVTTVTGGQFQAQILQQEASIESYDKQLENTKLVLETAKIAIDNAETAISNAETGVANAKEAFETTAAQFENTQVLYDAGLVAQNDYDRAKLGYTQAEAGLKQAEAGLKQATNGQAAAQKQFEQAQISYDTLLLAKSKAEEGLNLTTTTVADDNTRQASLAAESARASLGALLIQKELVENTLADTSVKSPISGVVSSRIARVNEYVSSQYPPYTIVDIGKVYVDVKVSELIINSLAPGLEVDVALSALGGGAVKGVIKTVAPAADQTGAFPVRIEINNDGGLLKPGMFAEVHFIKEQSISAVTLPRSVVLSDENGSYVYTIESDVAKKTYVTTGIDNGFEIEILSGVFGDVPVITKGHTFVSDNEKVNVTKTTEEK